MLQRELVGCFTHKELLEGHQGSFSHESITVESDLKLRDQVIRSARRAKSLQKQLSGAVFLHAMNLYFFKDLQKSLGKRPVYEGILLGLDFSERRHKSRRCYVKLREPAIEIKVFGEDLDYHYGCRYTANGEAYGRYGATVSIGPAVVRDDAEDRAPPTFTCGQCVRVAVGDYAKFYGQSSRSRWIFILEPALGNRPRVRNSILERDLGHHD